MKKYLLLFLFAIVLSACQKSRETDNAEHKVAENHNETEEYIVITPEQFKANDMAFGEIRQTQFPDYVEVTGMIDVPPKNKASVSPVMGGYVTDFNLLEGDYVKKGQVLFRMQNPEYIHMQEQYLATKNSLDYLKADYERQKELVKEQITSTKKFLKAKSDYMAALGRYQSLRKQLRMLNIDPDRLTHDQIRSVVAIVAPLSGYVTNINIEKGVYLEPRQVAMQVVNTTHKHVEMKVYEKDIHRLKKGQKIVFNLPDAPGKTYEGEVHLIGKDIDREKRTVNVHGHIHNETQTQDLLPGMFVEVKIATDMHQALTVPETAVTDQGDKHFVLVKVKEENGKIYLKPVEVKTEKTWNGNVEILPVEDLPAGTSVLVKGGYFLLNAGEEGGQEH